MPFEMNKKFYIVDTWFCEKEEIIDNNLEYVRESDKAILFNYELLGFNKTLWIPKSLIKEYLEDGQLDLFGNKPFKEE